MNTADRLARAGVKAITAVIIVAVGVPAAIYLDGVYAGALVGVAVATVANVAYWKARGESLRDVYLPEKGGVNEGH